MATILDTMPKGGGAAGGLSREEVVDRLCEDLLLKVGPGCGWAVPGVSPRSGARGCTRVTPALGLSREETVYRLREDLLSKVGLGCRRVQETS